MRMTSAREYPSKSRVDKAGSRLRDQAIDPVIFDTAAEELRESDISVVTAYRRSYSEPLLKVRMGLGSFKTTIGCADASITQRTKRYSRIVAKLVRFPSQRLSQMQDIGGVRVVLDSSVATDAMVEQIHRNWREQIRRHDDYVADPQPSGYRGHHIVVNRDGRLIEIQIRSENQHTWAEGVESTGRTIGEELKWGDGPSEILDYYTLLGGVVDLADRGVEIPDSVRRRVDAAQDAARKRILSTWRGGESDG